MPFIASISKENDSNFIRNSLVKNSENNKFEVININERNVENIKNVKFVNLCLIIALPFTPAFLVNIACGLSNVDKKKYLLSLLVGKIFLVIFQSFY